MQSLAEKLSALRKLDAERTQGEWTISFDHHAGKPYTFKIAAPDRTICVSENKYSALAGDGEFLHAAPTMMQVIAELVARLSVAREALCQLQIGVGFIGQMDYARDATNLAIIFRIE